MPSSERPWTLSIVLEAMGAVALVAVGLVFAMIFGTLIGGYSETYLGPWAILPAIAAFILLVTGCFAVVGMSLGRLAAVGIMRAVRWINDRRQS